MPLLTFISRSTDSLLLVASFSHTSPSSTTSSSLSMDTLDQYKSQAKTLLRKLSGSTHPAQGQPTKCTIDAGAYTFYYVHLPSIIYLTLTEKSYPKRLSFLYLDEISHAFEHELKTDYGESNWMDKVNQSARPYQFIKFDKQIQRISRQYSDPTSRTNSTKINSDLTEIHNIMAKNITDILERGEKLDDVGRVSGKMVEDSKKFKWGAKKLGLKALWNQYGIIGVMAFFVLFVLWFKFIR